MPMTVSAPSLIGETQPIIRIVEVLPAPFGPRKPNDSPRATSKSTWSTATNEPNRLVSPRAWMSGVEGVSDMGTHGTAGLSGGTSCAGLDVACAVSKTCYDAV